MIETKNKAHKYIVKNSDNISLALSVLKDTGSIGLVVCDEGFRMKGVITDGDIRRFLISGGSVDDIVEKASNKTPYYLSDGSDIDRSYCEKNYIHIIPICKDGLLIDILETSDQSEKPPVCIMAGGLGSRLGSLTKNCPKPLIEIGSQSIIERLIIQLKNEGFKNLFISVNYLKEKIIQKLGNGEKFGVEIKYLLEEKALGTAGALSLLPHADYKNFLVLNADLVSHVSFSDIFNYHLKNEGHATICSVTHSISIPYGVISTKNHLVESLIEKPKHKVNANAGIYVLSSEAISLVEKNSYLDMPSLINQLAEKKFKILCYPIIENWIDIGIPENLVQARDHFQSLDCHT